MDTSAKTDLDAYLEQVRAETKKQERDDMWNTIVMMAIGAALAYWAYRTVAHAVLFAFITYAVAAVGNKVVSEMRRLQVKAKAAKLMDDAGM